jgi:hypothetical protein
MSALSLRYPLKPYELADDLEAFVHVLIHCCLRFHQHDRSHNGLDPSLDRKQLTEKNGNNNRLGEYVATYFYQSWDCGQGISSGGEQKMLYINLGSPEFILDASVSRVLVHLVAELYQLLQRHYASIDFNKLEKYSPQKINPSSTSQTRPILSRKTLDHQPIFEIDIIEDQNSGNVSTPKHVECEESNMERSNILNTHDHILRAFRDAAIAIRNSGRYLPLDKTVDQFLGLSEFTGGVPSASTSSVSSKRAFPDTLASSMKSKKSRLSSDTIP